MCQLLPGILEADKKGPTLNAFDGSSSNMWMWSFALLPKKDLAWILVPKSVFQDGKLLFGMHNGVTKSTHRVKQNIKYESVSTTHIFTFGK